jgi:beta-glucanase (GH16 family)
MRGGAIVRIAATLAVLALLALAFLARPSAGAAGGAPADESPLTASPDHRPLKLTFGSDFQSFAANPGRDRIWRTTYGDGKENGPAARTLSGNSEQELYVDPAFGERIGAPKLNPFSETGGVLRITAKPADPALAAKLAGLRYVSGMISSQPSFSQLYGYFEARAKLPAGKGLWPALWMLPADMSWPPEIDIMESIGDPLTAYMSVHSTTEAAHSQKTMLADSGFHTFAVSWDPRQIIWYVDGVEVARRPTPADMHKPMYLLANLAVGGNWPGSPDSATAFPASFQIAYVRAYQFR